ncbi:unnamed protein product, partial [marine sediment metagenome]
CGINGKNLFSPDQALPLGGDQSALPKLDSKIEAAKKKLLSSAPSLQANVAKTIEDKLDAGTPLNEEEQIIYEALKQILEERQSLG